MSYQVLARKWRPKSFSTLVGQEHVVRALRNALQQQRLHHAYLFTGTRGVGKTTIARILSKSLNCETGITEEPCGICSACTQIDAGRFVDMLEIDAASNTGIDNIREVLENAQYAPTVGRFKVYLIDEVHMLSKSAFNAMLKTLEEPPAHVKFILATTDPQKVPITVLSRCLQFNLRQMTPQTVVQHLSHVLTQEGIAFDAAAIGLLGFAAQGSMRDALSLLDQAIAYGCGVVKEDDVRSMLGSVDQAYLFNLLTALVQGDGAQALEIAEHMASRSLSFEAALQDLAGILHQIAWIQQVPDALPELTPHLAALTDLAQTISPEQVQLYYQIVLHGKRDLPLAPDESMGFGMTLLRLLAFNPVTQAVVEPEKSLILTPITQPKAQTKAPLPEPSGQATSPAVTAPMPVPTAKPMGTAQSALQNLRASLQPAKATVASALVREPASIAPATPAPLPLDSVSTPVAEPLSTEGAGVFNGDWHAFIEAINPSGLLRQLAQHTCLKSHDATSFELVLPEAYKHLLPHADKLKALMSSYLAQPIRLTIELGEVQGETLAQKQQQAKAQVQANAEQTLAQDAVVLALQQQLDASVLSVQPR